MERRRDVSADPNGPMTGYRSIGIPMEGLEPILRVAPN
jgi:hypothetical protein